MKHVGVRSSAADVASQEQLSFTASGTGGATRTFADKVCDYTNVLDYGAVADDTTDCSTAFANAMAAAIARGHKRVFVPGAASNYRLASTLTIATTGVMLFGDGMYATKIRSESTGAAISVNTGLSGVIFKDFQLTRTAGTASSGKDGIKFNTLTEQARIENVLLSRHWIGLSLCATSYSFVKEILARDNYSHGVQVANNASYAGLQWSFFKCLAQTNDGYGLYVTTAAGAASASVGDIQLFSTYANKLGGVKFAGTATSPINAIRWFGGFVGEDGGHGFELDTYNASNHKIDGLFSEIAGTSACGVDMSTAATNVGRGINVTANNGWVDLIGCAVVGNSHSGIDMSASRFQIIACDVRLNGAAGTAGERNGIRCRAGQGLVTASVSKGHFNFGIFTDVDSVAVTANDVRENTGAGFASAVSVVTSVVAGNMGSTVNNLVGPLQVSGNLTTKSGLIGYDAGAGGTVTQLTDKSTAVTLNSSSGVITMSNAAMANGAVATFTLNCSLIAATSTVIASAAGFAGPYRVSVGNVQAGSCQVSVQNSSGGSLSDALKINFAVLGVATT